MKFLTWVFERDGLVWVKQVHRFYKPETKSAYLIKYFGNACFLGNRIFFVGCPVPAKDVLAETIIHPVRRRSLSILHGVTLSVGFMNNQAFSAPVVWEYLGTSIDIKEELRRTGIVPAGSPTINPGILHALGPAPDFPEPFADDADLR